MTLHYDITLHFIQIYINLNFILNSICSLNVIHEVIPWLFPSVQYLQKVKIYIYYIYTYITCIHILLLCHIFIELFTNNLRYNLYWIQINNNVNDTNYIIIYINYLYVNKYNISIPYFKYIIHYL